MGDTSDSAPLEAAGRTLDRTDLGDAVSARPLERPLERLMRLVADAFGVADPVIHWSHDDGPRAQTLADRSFSDSGESTICALTVDEGDVLVIPDLREDPRTCDLSCVTGAPGRRFYAGVPLMTPDRRTLGALDLFDGVPGRGLDGVEADRLWQYSRLIVEMAAMRSTNHASLPGEARMVELDAATGLRSRAALVRAAQRMVDTAGEARDIGVIKVRLDGMDRVRAKAGEQGCSDVLRAASARLRELIAPHDMLARGDGDNFLLLRLVDASHERASLEDWLDSLSNQALARFAEPFQGAGQAFRLSASVGSAAFFGHSVIYDVVDAASAASLGSQEDGGNRAKRFTSDALAGCRECEGIELELRGAGLSTDFTVNYQPVVDMTTGAVAGAEALVRWPRGEGEAVGPDTFVPVAESIGMIHELGMAVFDAVCSDLGHWYRRGWQLEIAVNLSPVQLDAPALADHLARRVRAAGLPCSLIKLEITESALTTHVDAVAQTLAALRAAGFRLSLDDFGTGYSSLARLIHMPFETIKVDRTFVGDAPGGPGAAVVTSVSALARDLGMTLIAEGVEYDEQQRFLLDRGYRYAQGYLYAQPMPAASLSDYLSRTS